jgi:aspartate racemase
VLPEGDSRQLVHESYREMAFSARVTSAQRQVFFSSGLRMCQEQEAEAVILAGTDLFLAFQDQVPGFPVIDCAAIHIDAIYQWSCGNACAINRTPYR